MKIYKVLNDLIILDNNITISTRDKEDELLKNDYDIVIRHYMITKEKANKLSEFRNINKFKTAIIVENKETFDKLIQELA